MSEPGVELPSDREPAIRVLAMPADTNAAGDIFGGWLMSQVDVAGSIAAYHSAQGRVVTRAVHEFQFLKPVYVGDLVSCYAEVVQVGRSSIRVRVEVFAQRERGNLECHRVSQAVLTYVAIDREGRPRTVPEQA